MFGAMLLSVVLQGCAGHLEVKAPVAQPFDALIVPGCPTLSDGALTRCLQRRAVWAALLWEQRQAEYFITSGAAVHTPFVEAEALAAAMTALGVPADRIFLEPHALHTEENIFNGLRIARKKGWSRLGVASDRGQAIGACQMLMDWHKQCGAFSMDTAVVDSRRSKQAGLLSSLRARQVSDFQPLQARERERAQRHNRSARPPSFVLYPLMMMRRSFGRAPWQPFHPDETPLITWAEQAKRFPLL
jgi:hypothetical protein